LSVPLACTVVREIDRLEALRAEWAALSARSATDEPTLSPLWMLAWWRVFGSQGGRSLRVALFYDGPRLVGLAPLLLRRHWYPPGIPFRRLELLASGEEEPDEICSDYIGVLAERGTEQQVAEALSEALTTGALGDWDELTLLAMNGETVLPNLLAAAFDARGVAIEQAQISVAPYIALPGSWEAYLAALPSSKRYWITRSLRDFERWSGTDARVERVQDPDGLVEGRRILHALHGERWRDEGHAGVFASNRFRAFHDTVLPQMLAAGALDLSWLIVRNEPIAVLYNLIWNRKCYFYQSGRRTQLPKGIRPGVVLHVDAIRRAIVGGLREYDFLAGDSRYKLEFASAQRPIVRLRAARSSTKEALRRFAQRGIDRVRVQLRRT
jgi:CelD/BcsL family acetyltransferase involved in cellulose biosynthesis